MGKILELFQLFPILLIDHCNIHVPCYLYKGILSTFIHSTATLSQYTRTTNISCIIFRYSTQDVLNWDMQEYKRQHLLRKQNSSPFVTNKTEYQAEKWHWACLPILEFPSSFCDLQKKLSLSSDPVTPPQASTTSQL